jgi:large subunit ribosomal protein L4
MANVIPVLTKGGQKSGEVTLPAALFGVEPNEHVMHEAVRTYLANQRMGTAHRKGRSDVRGGGKKPWRQKGTGRARIGSSRVSHWTGGLAFGPKRRDMGMKLPKKLKRLALTSALSAKAAEDGIKIVEDLELGDVSTKEMASVLKAIGVGTERTLLVVTAADRAVALSARNIPNVKLARAAELTAYHLLRAETVVMTKGALATVEEVFGE